MKKKSAYLTIDDAPSSMMKAKVTYLAGQKIPAVWFCQGDLLEKRPGLALSAIEQGFVLGNHSYNHPPFSELELEACQRQIRQTDEIIAALYQKAGVKRPAKCFRFPYGDKGGDPATAAGLARKQALQTYLRDLGYRQPHWEDVTYRSFRAKGLQDDVDWYWTYDVMDWSIFAQPHQDGIDSLEKVFERMDDQGPAGYAGLTKDVSAEIILMHDHTETAAYFEPIIERLLEKGLVFQEPSW